MELKVLISKHFSTGYNFGMKFYTKIKYIDDQPGNYRETLRKNVESLNKLNWSPNDLLYNYIMSL